MKKIKQICAVMLGVMLSIQALSIPVHAAPLSNEEEVYSFSNEDFIQAANTAYEKGELSKENLNAVVRLSYARLGIKGVNKIVKVNSNTYDYYLNSLVWGTITIVGIGGASAILTALPGLSPALAGFIGSVAGGVGGSLLSAEKGVIIRIKMTDVSAGIGTPRYVYEFISIKEQ